MGTSEAPGEWTSLLMLEQFRGGDGQAAEALFDRYFDRLTALARSRLSSRVARRADPEDVALSVYRSFFFKAREGRYVLSRGGDLWRLLSSIAIHKLLKRLRHERAARRSYEAEIPLGRIAEERLTRGSNEPTPEEALALADELEWVVSRLDVFGRRVLELRLQGLPVPEIAQEAGRSERSVRRSLARIRGLMADRLNEKHEQIRDEPSRGDAELEEVLPGHSSQSSGLSEPASVAVPLLSHRDFLLRRLIGAGRTGKVYEARSQVGRSEVAVKFLRKSLLKHPDVVRRFVDEARIVAGLRHPNVVETHGLGRTDGGSYFLVMELVTGSDLASHAGGRVIAEGEAIGWVVQICDALGHAHARGVVHCDLKPANILLDDRGAIKVTDFGLARSLVGGTERIAAIEGTAPFMAPEQVSRSWGAIDPRTDIYGIGAVLFTLLTGQPPFVGRGLTDILADVVASTPVISPTRLRPGLSEPLSEICRRCLSKPPEARYQSVGELRSALVAVRNGPPPDRRNP